jgi:hypothetical protein
MIEVKRLAAKVDAALLAMSVRSLERSTLGLS